MNIKTGLEIFKSIWLIEEKAGLAYLDYWEHLIKTGATQWQPKSEEKIIQSANIQQLFNQSNIVFAPLDAYSNSAQDFAKNGFAGAEVAVIMLDGPLMKNDYCGMYGTATLRQFFQLAENTDSVKSIVLMVDSPGGTVDGNAALAQTIAASKKYTSAIISGYCCSSAYWIASACNEVIATSGTDIIGSIGTMAQWYDTTKADEINGVVLREFYATKSTDKNRAFNEANAGNGKLLVETYLDPLNNEFIKSVQQNRAGKFSAKEDVTTGKTYLAKPAQAAGLIDKILSAEDALMYSLTAGKRLKNTTMSFEKVMKLANATEFKVVDDGFLLTEENLNAIEAAATVADETAAQLETALAKHSEDMQAIGSQLSATQEQLTSATTAKANAEAEIVTLKALTAGNFTSTEKKDDKGAAAEVNEFETSADIYKKKMDALYAEL